MRRWWLLAGVAMALWAPGAQAATPSIEGAPPRVIEDAGIAEAFWGREVTGCTSITYSAHTANPAALGEATVPPVDHAVPCVMEIAEARHMGPMTECLVVTHEYGHLLGELHNSDPNSVMYEGGLRRWSVPGCRVFRAEEELLILRETLSAEATSCRHATGRERTAECRARLDHLRQKIRRKATTG